MASGELLSTNEAAATLTLGTDVFRNNRKNSSAKVRRVDGFTVIGSQAINDFAVDIFAGDHYFGRFLNSRAGVAAAVIPDDYQAVAPTMVAPGDRITGIITDAASTSPVLIKCYGEEFAV